MVQNILVKILLAPFSLLYGLGVSLRDFLYRQGLLKSIEFNVPIISIGNLSVGGAGKTPHIEYLIRLFKDYINVSTLSRGYKRESKGYMEVQPQHSADITGDEPLQYKRKYPDILVAVSESRALGIPEIVKRHPNTQAVLLDDAFQHLSVKPGLNILLTEYDHPFTRDYLLPSGRLREWRSAYRRADVIIVSKCPPVLTAQERDQLIKEIKPFPHQRVFFTYYHYKKPYYLFNSKYRIQLQPDIDILLISAIAKTEYLLSYMEEQVENVFTLEYEDHHFFTNQDVSNLVRTYEQMESAKKLIITTEKDAVRLEKHHAFLREKKLPIFVLPVEVYFHFGESPQFDQLMKDYLLNFKV